MAEVSQWLQMTMTHVDMPTDISSFIALEQQCCISSVLGSWGAFEQGKDLPNQPHVSALGLFPKWNCRIP